MSRLSRANLKARESVFHSGAEIFQADSQATCPPSLFDCVLTMQDCCEQARDAELILRDGTYDYPRMINILSNERVFLLTNEATVKSYKAELVDDIEPAINELMTRAQQGLKNLQKKESQLRTKSEALKALPARPATGTMAEYKLDQRRLHTATKQKERLRYEMASLETEIKELDRKPRR